VVLSTILKVPEYAAYMVETIIPRIKIANKISRSVKPG
jgi:hypothetical protein